jgi:hypothetical protein
MNKAYIMPLNVLKNGTKQIVLGAGLSLLKPKFFNVDVTTAANENTGIEEWDKKSLLGTPIYDIVTFAAHSYVDELGQTINNSKLDLDIALIEVNKPRNIVRTVIAGRSGTIKEYMSDGDYEISISGTLTNTLAFSSPDIAIRAFDAITKTPQELKVESNFLNYFNIFNIVIVSSKIKQREGARNIVEYELTCISDTPFEIRSEDEDKGNISTSRPMF